MCTEPRRFKVLLHSVLGPVLSLRSCSELWTEGRGWGALWVEVMGQTGLERYVGPALARRPVYVDFL